MTTSVIPSQKRIESYKSHGVEAFEEEMRGDFEIPLA
jgi:hypothetical protein